MRSRTACCPARAPCTHFELVASGLAADVNGARRNGSAVAMCHQANAAAYKASQLRSGVPEKVRIQRRPLPTVTAGASWSRLPDRALLGAHAHGVAVRASLAGSPMCMQHAGGLSDTTVLQATPASTLADGDAPACHNSPACRHATQGGGTWGHNTPAPGQRVAQLPSAYPSSAVALTPYPQHVSNNQGRSDQVAHMHPMRHAPLPRLPDEERVTPWFWRAPRWLATR